MNDFEIIDFSRSDSVVSQYMSELRDVDIQHDPLRFRDNLRRIGTLMAYEISRRLKYADTPVQTPLGVAPCRRIAQPPVIATLLRAGLPFHQGFLEIFDRADNAFVSAYRKYRDDGNSFDVLVEYLASPIIEGRTLLLVDPMLATGSSMELGFRAMLTKGEPEHIHVCSVIASQQGVDYVAEHFPADRTTLWVGAIDDEMNSHGYIVPGLGDAGDLAFGQKDDR